MKNRHFFTSVIVTIIALPYFSCKSAPQAPQPSRQPASPATQAAAPAATPAPASSGRLSQAVSADLKAASDKAEQARAQAADFDGDSYFPSEWEAAEGRFAQASHLPKGSDAEARNAISTYNAASNAFDSIFTMAIPLYAQAREDEIMAIRGNLIDRGAKTAFPEFFTPADETAVLALEQYKAKDYYPARDSAVKALYMYEFLDIAWDAMVLKREIDEREFVSYNPDHYERAGQVIGDAMDTYRADNLPLAKEIAEEALLRYQLILSTAWAEYAGVRSEMTDGERLAALDMKTNISAREYFSIADMDNKTALELLESEEYEEAAKLFINSEAMYVISSMSALEKRRIATEVLKEALDKIEESDKAAWEAEAIIEGGQ